MNLILGLDPSINSPGVALIYNNEVVHSHRVIVPKDVRRVRAHGERVDGVVFAILCYLNPILRSEKFRSDLGFTVIDTLVYEWPQIYKVGKSKGDPNDLLALAAIGSAITQQFHPIRVLTPTPREWMGGTSKNTKGDPWDCTRGRKLKARLTNRELDVIPPQHDALDAVGLALHATSRALAKPIKKYSRGGVG